MSDEGKIAVIACAGMDKALGSVAMLSVSKVVEALRPTETRLIALPPLLAGVAPYRELITKLPVIVVDGCAERCTTKLIAKSGGRIRGRILVTDSVKKYGLSPSSAVDVGPEGRELAEKIAEEVASIVDKICGRQGD
jgi:uncharacterized metal-binding protein